MPLELTAEEIATIQQARDLKAKAAFAATYDTSADEETALETAAPSVPVPKPGERERALPAPAKHHAYVVEKARSFGFSDDEIGSVSEETLIAQVRGAEKMIAAERQAAAIRQDAQAVERVRPTPPEPVKKADDLDDLDISDVIPLADQDQYDPAYLKTLRRIERKRMKELADLRAELTPIKKAAEVNQAQQLDTWLDNQFAAISRDREFGKGSINAMLGTPAARRRTAVYAEMIALGGVNAKNFTVAVETLYGKAKAAPADQPAVESAYAAGAKTPPGRNKARVPPEPTAEDFEEGQVARPTNRRGAAEVKGAKLAEQKLSEFMREQGITDIEDDGGDLDGFL